MRPSSVACCERGIALAVLRSERTAFRPRRRRFIAPPICGVTDTLSVRGARAAAANIAASDGRSSAMREQKGQ